MTPSHRFNALQMQSHHTSSSKSFSKSFHRVECKVECMKYQNSQSHFKRSKYEERKYEISSNNDEDCDFQFEQFEEFTSFLK